MLRINKSHPSSIASIPCKLLVVFALATGMLTASCGQPTNPGDAGRDTSIDAINDTRLETGTEDVTAIDAAGEGGVDASMCEAGTTLCNGSCVDTNTNVSHCGGCGIACPSVLNGRATCTGGVCGFTCGTGYHRCGDRCADDNSVATCGSRCEPCPAPANATATCMAGMCGFTCNAGYHRCGDRCADDNSVATCGSRCEPCPVPANAVMATCTAGTCGFVCRDGYMASGDMCVPIPPPRPIAPLSTAIVTSQRPTLRWQLGMGTDGARVELCRDRAMTRNCQTIDATGTRATPTSALMPGVWFWRLRGRAGSSVGTDTGPVWQFTVGARSAETNTSWGTVLDVNGDGYSDVIVGAPYANGNAGQVYVYMGGPSGLVTTPARTYNGSSANTYFGASVASAGDVNGDGFGDIVIGAYGYAGRGAIYVCPGSATGAPAARCDQRIDSPSGSGTGHFGWSVASAGDTNGDGYADVIVGAPNWNRAYLYRGGPSGLGASPAHELVGPDGGSFGASVASAGDEGDGYSDVLIGAPEAFMGSGRVYYYRGAPGGLRGMPDITLNNGRDGGSFGFSVAGAGDVDNDGMADVIVGAPRYSSNCGRAYLYTGNAFFGLNRSPASILDPLSCDFLGAQNFGHSAAGAGDLNGDGYADVIVGAWSFDRNSGMALLFPGGPTGLDPMRAAALQLDRAQANDYFGAAVASAGDVNGDLFADVLVGAHGRDVLTATDTGSVALHMGASTWPPTMMWVRLRDTLMPGVSGIHFGYSVAGAAR